MSKRAKKQKQMSGLIGAVILIMLVALFIVGLSMLPDVLLLIQSILGVDEFASEFILFIGLFIGIGILGYKGMEKYN